MSVWTLGLETVYHKLPFQCMVRDSSKPLPSWKYPTAQMSLAEMAVTPSRTLLLVLGPALFAIFQAVPFQCSINVWTVPSWRFSVIPTAQTFFGVIATTPVRIL